MKYIPYKGYTLIPGDSNVLVMWGSVPVAKFFYKSRHSYKKLPSKKKAVSYSKSLVDKLKDNLPVEDTESCDTTNHDFLSLLGLGAVCDKGSCILYAKADSTPYMVSYYKDAFGSQLISRSLQDATSDLVWFISKILLNSPKLIRT